MNIGGSGLVDPRYAALGDNKKMNGGLGCNVAEGGPFLSLGNDVGRDFPGSDLLKKGHQEKRIKNEAGGGAD